MSMIINYEKLISLLPNGEKNKYPMINDNESSNLNYTNKRLQGFVAPNLTYCIDEKEEKPQIIVISASGAVGKSTLAQTISFDQNVPMWDLSLSKPVGQHSLSGVFLDSFDADQVGPFKKALNNGDMFVIIDALDEARVKVSEAGFHAFIEDIAKTVKGHKVTQFLLFGRTQICETIWLLLTELKITTSLLTINPFDEQQSFDYIQSKIYDFWTKNNISHQDLSSVQFIESRNLILDCLKNAIIGTSDNVDEDEVREVLGYAPVLDSISVMLAQERNYYKLSEKFKQMKGDSHLTHVELLQNVVEHILKREQQYKLSVNIQPAMQSTADTLNWSNWDVLYTPTEQTMRLLGLINNIQLNDFSDANPDLKEMPFKIRSDYESQLAPWLPEHPFLKDGKKPANSVFESYLYASALCKDRLAGCYKHVENYLKSSKYKSSRLLSDFYFLFMKKIDNNYLKPNHIGIIYESTLSSETSSHKISLSIDGIDPEEIEFNCGGEQTFITEGEIEILYFNNSSMLDLSKSKMLTEFKTKLSCNDTIRFSNRLRKANIIVPCTVELGNDSAGFELGPDVYLKCYKLRLINESLTVLGESTNEIMCDADAAVIIEALDFEQIASIEPIVHGEFSVCWNGSDSYPWKQFTNSSILFGEKKDILFSEAYRRFRRIVLTLKSHSRGGLAKLKDKIECSRVLQGQLGQELLARMINDEILVLKGVHYHWVPEKADQYVGISWQQLRKGEMSLTLEDYLNGFIQSRHP